MDVFIYPFFILLINQSIMKKQIETAAHIESSMKKLGLKTSATPSQLADMLQTAVEKAPEPFDKMPDEVQKSVKNLQPPEGRRFHGAKMSLLWFPSSMVPYVRTNKANAPIAKLSRAPGVPSVNNSAGTANRFGYMSSGSVRNSSKLPFTAANRSLLEELGAVMGAPGREPGADSPIPAGYTYFGQFVDHDITLDVSSSLDVATNANNVPNMRTPVLELDAVYGRGPGLDPFLYKFPDTGEPPTAIRMQVGSNRDSGPGGPGGIAQRNGMQIQTTFDVPRMTNFLNPSASSNTAIIGDPRNDENLIVSQFHHAMLMFHNKTVDVLVAGNFSGDIFVEAKRIVIHHYQFALVHDFLKRICGTAAVNNALQQVTAAVNSPFKMPVEFSVAAYRLGHSMIRDNYWVNFNFPDATLGQVFQFIHNPQLPVLSNWVVDFNAFFDTGVSVPVNNKARKLDTILATGLDNLPGFSGLMAVLAKRNLLRGLAMGLPSGQAMATSLGITPLTKTQLLSDLPVAEAAILTKNNGLLSTKTPLWYYILREAAVLSSGDTLGPLGAKIVADTFVRMLKRDEESFLHVAGGFIPSVPSRLGTGQFDLADLIIFSGVNQPQ
jgi:hypothetical protein